MPNRIFVIDDDEATRYAYEKVLQLAGFQTAAFGTYFAAAPEIDGGAGALYVIDLQLPVGSPQGDSIARMVRYRRPHIPVIFVTGWPEIAAMTDLDIGPILLKPIDLTGLVARVRRLLAARPMPWAV